MSLNPSIGNKTNVVDPTYKSLINIDFMCKSHYITPWSLSLHMHILSPRILSNYKHYMHEFMKVKQNAGSNVTQYKKVKNRRHHSYVVFWYGRCPPDNQIWQISLIGDSQIIILMTPVTIYICCHVLYFYMTFWISMTLNSNVSFQNVKP